MPVSRSGEKQGDSLGGHARRASRGNEKEGANKLLTACNYALEIRESVAKEETQ